MPDCPSPSRTDTRFERYRRLGPPLVLLMLGIATRVPFRSSILHHWDSVNFALALEQFDIRSHQPHPPGTFLLYVVSGRLVQRLLHDANTSLVALSIAATGVAAALTFVLATRWFGRRTGWLASLLLLSSPLVWFHGEIALTYAPELACVLAIVLACVTAHDGSRAALFTSALLMGLAGGVRANTLVFLLPLWLFTVGASVRERRCSRAQALAATLVMIAAFLSWFIPLLAISGGLAAYWGIIRGWMAAQLTSESVWREGPMRVARFATYVLWGLGVAVVPVAWMLGRSRHRWRSLLRDRRVQFLALWIVPGAAYLLGAHLRQPGHVFTILPALLIVGGLATAQLAERWGTKRGVAAIAFILSCNILLFFSAPDMLFGDQRLIFRTPSWTTIRAYDAYVSERLAAIRSHFSPADTAVIAGSYNFRIPDFYLRDYQCLSLSRDATTTVPQVLPDHVHQLVVFDDSVLPRLNEEDGLESLPLPSSGRIRALKWTATQQVQLSLTTLQIAHR
jgi:hypothetical protein